MFEIAATSKIYIDTSIFIYYIESHSTFVKKVKDLFEQIESAGAQILTNELAIAECIYAPAKAGNKKALLAYSKLFESGEIIMLPLDGALAQRAALNGGRLGLKLNDAIHFTSAIESGCNFFVTSDRRFKSGSMMQVITVKA